MINNLCYISLGSNLKSPERQLRQGIAALKRLPATSLIKTASFYQTKAWGLKGQPDFYNTVVAIKTSLTPQQLLSYCLLIEQKHGRVRKIKWGSRTLDLDLIFFGNRKIVSKNLTIPHPRWKLRDFVLQPLLELNSKLGCPFKI